MRKVKNIVIAVIIIFIAGGGFYFFSKQNLPLRSASPSGPQNSAEKNSMMDRSGSSRYVEYSKEVLGSAAGKRRVLYFYANWCPTCRPADADFQKNTSQIPEDVILIRVNYNDSDTDAEEKALAEKYGITYQHTFVQIDADGNEVTKWNGGQIKELLINVK